MVAAAIVQFLLSGCMSSAMKQVGEPQAGRAMGGRIGIVYSNRYQITFGGLEKLHPFDIRKYEKIFNGLVDEGLLKPSDVFVPNKITREDLLRVHSADYLDKRLRSPADLARYLEIGVLAIVPASITDASILEPFRHATGGTLLAADVALSHGIGINIGGGYHHAEPEQGGGFCIYADMPIAVRRLMSQGRVKRVLMIDVDVHQGNGTAVCLADDPNVFTFDIYELDIYPWPKEKNDIDVPLPAGVKDDEYLERLGKYLPILFERADPDLVFLQAGVDSLDGDPLANMRLTIEGIVKRDEMIVSEAVNRNKPIVMTLGGGYSADAWLAQYKSISNLIRRYGVGSPGDTASPATTQPTPN